MLVFSLYFCNHGFGYSCNKVKVRRQSLWETSWQENFWFQLFGNRIRSSFTSSAIFHSFFLLSAHLSFFPLLAVFCCWFQFFLSNNPHLIFRLKIPHLLQWALFYFFSFYLSNFCPCYLTYQVLTYDWKTQQRTHEFKLSLKNNNNWKRSSPMDSG